VAFYRRVTKYLLLLSLSLLLACKGKSGKHETVKDADAAVVASPRDATVDGGAKGGRPEHAVFKLVDNRHTAHRSVDNELVIDATNVGFARYTKFGVPVQRWHMAFWPCSFAGNATGSAGWS